ncbi:hypothetical protein J2T20_000873 [Paenibacillus wynnii]|nr:hypothetical protein [Paenibacillus wynnii]
MKKTAPLLMMIPAYIVILFLIVYQNHSLSDFTKGSVTGIVIGLILATVFIILLQLCGIQLKQWKHKKFKARLLRSK